MGGGRKKVILFFAGTAWLRSCRFLFHQFIQWDKAHKIIGNADVLPPFAAALVRGFNVDCLDKLTQGVRGQLLQILVFVYPLDKLLQVFNLSFLYFNVLLQGLDFCFELHLFVPVRLAHHSKPLVREFPGHIVLIDADEQPVKLNKAFVSLRKPLLVCPDGFLTGQPEAYAPSRPGSSFRAGLHRR